MAKKKTKLIHAEPVYYAYYDLETRKILSVTNEKSVVYKDFIEITFAEFHNFVTGNWQFKDYVVNRNPIEIISISDQVYSFKNSAFEWITEPPTIETELIIVWEKAKSRWVFKLSQKCKDRIQRSGVYSNLSFFVMLESDFDFLIRTIPIPMHDLVQYDEYKIPFENNLEKNIKKISIATSKIFDTTGLEIINE